MESAASWIADMGTDGDFGRKFVLDEPMLGRVRAKSFRNALDVGCGEGRFCRVLRALGIEAVGIELIRWVDQPDAKEVSPHVIDGGARKLGIGSNHTRQSGTVAL